MLKLTVSNGDKILVGDEIIINVAGMPPGKRVRLEFDAPKEVKIFTVFKDSKLQFKNRKRRENV